MQENPSDSPHVGHKAIGLCRADIIWLRNVLMIFILVLVLGSCAKGPFVPVNTGREYGSPKTPSMVSHLPEANQWALKRTGHHNVFQKILCFNYACRKMIGRRKVLKAISFEKLKKKIRKNAKKGAYKKYVPSNIEIHKGTIVVPGERIEIVDTVIVPMVVAPILKADSLITLNEFLFEINSFKLKVEQLEELDSIAKFLKSHPTLEVNISGHTDNTGSERHNVSLSTRRAEVVAEYLIDKGAVYGRVTYRGYGSSLPIDSNDNETGRRKNRRVEILISNPKEK